jgi:hypothetical protein
MIEQICDCIYEECRGFGVGHLVWAPVPHLEEVPRILEVERAGSQEHYASRFSIVQTGNTHFRPKQKLPIKLLSLGETEELLVSKAKKRPCIIVAADNTAFEDEKTKTEIGKRRHLQDQSMLLAPIYGTASNEIVDGFPPIMTARIRALLYSQFFYLPDRCPKTKVSLGREGIVRLDRVFAATPTRGLSLMDKRLAKEPLAILLAVLRERLGGPRDENLGLFRELLRDLLPEEALPGAGAS